jgi:tetratricopeptide (TPR) repeat protein
MAVLELARGSSGQTAVSQQAARLQVFAAGLSRALRDVMATTKRQVRSLDYPDLFFFRAAEGWFELGNFVESAAELDRIRLKWRTHFDVLHLRWRLLAHAQQWDRCLVVGRALTDGYPNNARSWLTLAETYYLMGDIRKAYRVAAANAVEFPECWHLLYDTACYACLLGKFDEAKQFFQLAMRVGDAKTIRRRALEDPNLEPLWEPPPAPRRERAA